MLITLAELNLDASVASSLSPTNTSAAAAQPSTNLHLEACADWLALAQEADLLSGLQCFQEAAALDQQSSKPEKQLPEAQPETPALGARQAQLAARFSWSSAQLADCRQDHQAAIIHLTNTAVALEALSDLAGRGDGKADLRDSSSVDSSTDAERHRQLASISLRHRQHDGTISSSTVMAKLQVLKLEETRQEALSLLEADAAPEALVLLQWELLQDVAFAAKASQHDGAGFVRCLRLLLVSGLSTCILFINIAHRLACSVDMVLSCSQC